MDFKIRFRPLQSDDARFINNLRNMESMERMLGGSMRPVAYERDVKWVEDIILGDSQSTIFFAITLAEADDIIGYTSISEIDYRNGTCFWSGIKIGEGHGGKGLGKQVTLKILKYVFEELRMERCKAECLEEHETALKMMLATGYKQEGLMRKKVFKNGAHNNQWLLSVIREDYAEIKKEFNL